MLLFFLLLKIFFAEQLPFTSLHWKLIFGYFLLLSVAVLVYPVFRKMRDQDRWSIQNGAIEIEEGVLHLSVVRGRETRRLNVHPQILHRSTGQQQHHPFTPHTPRRGKGHQ